MAHVYWIHLPKHTDIYTQGYVGVCKADDINVRWSRHKLEARKEDGCNYTIYKAIRKYGAHNLVWDIVFTGPYIGCLQLEEYWRSAPNIGWNIHAGGRSQSPMQGRKHTKETCKKLSEIKTGHIRSEESRRKQAETQKGHILSDETKLKISKAQSGKANNGVLKRRRKIKASSGEVFESLTKAAEWVCISYTSICKHLKNVYSYAGVHPITKEKLTWEYLNG